MTKLERLRARLDRAKSAEETAYRLANLVRTQTTCDNYTRLHMVRLDAQQAYRAAGGKD